MVLTDPMILKIPAALPYADSLPETLAMYFASAETAVASKHPLSRTVRKDS
jgi:hypothetical protein